jgi:pimeloyl-ACP methyl ester carboxylesterase
MNQADTEPAALAHGTFVLVHGGFHGGWCWKGVTQRLRAAGYEVYTPTLTGLGERSHLISCSPTLETWIEDVAQVIRYEDLDDVILVGHSFAGPIISALADRNPEVLRHLVFLDAQILHSGESPATRGPERVKAYKQRAINVGSVLAIPPAAPEDFGVHDPEAARSMARKLSPHPLQTYYDAVVLQNPLCNGIASTYIACSQPFFPATELARKAARQTPGWTYLEIATGHDAMITAPAELADILGGIARSC